MRTKVNPASLEVTVARILAALEQELIDATDAEIREAAHDLGMNLDMAGSAAFAGLRYPAKASFAEYFGPDALAQLKEFAEARRRERDDKPSLPSSETKDDAGKKS
jgi:hypothetical protein